MGSNSKSQNKSKTKGATPIQGQGFSIRGQGEMTPEAFDMLVRGRLFWQRKAEDLMWSAQVLWSINCQKFREQVLGTSFDVVWMLSGFALENAFKAAIVPIIKEKQSGHLPKELRGHDLNKLAEMARVDIDSNEKAMLAYLTEFIMAYGRYPTHTSHEKMHKNGMIGSNPEATFQTVSAIWVKALAVSS
jgi:hypothetical protein